MEEEERGMTRDEMQRFLDMMSRKGFSELAAYRNLAEVIGIAYHPGPETKAEKA